MCFKNLNTRCMAVEERVVVLKTLVISEIIRKTTKRETFYFNEHLRKWWANNVDTF